MENPMILFFAYFLETLIILYYSRGLFVPKYEGKKTALSLLLFYGFLYLLSFLESPIVNLTFFTLCNYIYFYFFFSVSWYGAAFHTFIFTGFMAISEYLSLPLIRLFSPTFMTLEYSSVEFLLYAFTNKFLFLICICFLRYLITGWNKNNLQQDKSSLLLLLFPLSSSITLAFLILLTLKTASTPLQNTALSISGFLTLTSYILIFMVNQQNQEKYEELTSIRLRLQKDADLAAYYQMLDEQDENQRILIHDIKKHLQSIAFLNENHEHRKLSQYVNQLLQSSELKDSLRICDHPILNSILCRYIKQAKEGQLSFHTDIRKSSTHFLTDQEVTAIFCNLLDNAFQAARQVPEGYVELYVCKQPKTPFVSLSLINSCRKDPFSRDGKLLLPRKDKNGYHGYGIKSVEKIVKKYYGEMKMYYDTENKTFHTILYMKVNR